MVVKSARVDPVFFFQKDTCLNFGWGAVKELLLRSRPIPLLIFPLKIATGSVLLVTFSFKPSKISSGSQLVIPPLTRKKEVEQSSLLVMLWFSNLQINSLICAAFNELISSVGHSSYFSFSEKSKNISSICSQRNILG